ncbi:thiamine pyrophosphate-binding protein [Pigmentiphaga litoralis]|uniref:Acetolactate synthase-1/2/3 large subunit n=1 Tax=Pigmentiphaga litoralis TaxID=516702 RepID=A0A7Y9IZD2_9BURK|nr:thiamine pyrophosphate-binding protein [Pigmentiphaga litoralis]NYE26058.1 acetolactate synthase-1/2/3 large subunit [Pigmentiphaga litoralis]NYE85178.1 acetolactate synthase-1/2/3 large subunit [Pigmentiphaga litoralis]
MTAPSAESRSAASNATTARSGGQLLVDALAVQGVDRVFCVPGESYLDVLDALYAHPDIETIVTKHEGAAANMAEADGKLMGRPGICFVTRGPGATHAAIGVHIAQQDSTPMILFVGQAPREHLGREAFQEVDYAATFGSMAKWAGQIEDTARIPEMVARAFQVATSGRPGPVVLALPEDVLGNSATVPDTLPYQVLSPAPTADQAADIAKLLASAKQPLVIVGGANWPAQATADFKAFVQAWNLPVAASFRRQDLFDNRDPHYVGHLSLGMNPALAERVQTADVILAVGTRLGEINTAAYTLLEVPTPKQQLIHIHVDAAELGRVYRPTLAVQAAPAPAAAMLKRLEAPAAGGNAAARSAGNATTNAAADAAGTAAAGAASTDAANAASAATNAAATSSATPAWAGWTEAARAAHVAFSAAPKPAADYQGVVMADVMAHLNATLPDDAILANGAGNYTVWVHRFFQFRQSRTSLAPVCGAMGYGFPAAIAAKLRYPEREVIAFAGDGCFLMYPQELATALQFGANVVTIVVNNGMYGTIRMHQEKRFPGRISATKLQNPDFVAMAAAFGAHAELVEKTEDFPAAFERARKAGRPALLELRVDPKQITPAVRLGSVD